MKNSEVQSKIKASVKAASLLYKRYVELDSNAANIRGQIAKLALEVCDVRRGGNYEGIYTLKQFAKDIGMSSTTLSDWTLIYKTGLKIDITEPTEEEWARLRQALAVEKQEKSKFAQKLGIKKGNEYSGRENIRDIVGHKHRKGRFQYKFSPATARPNYTIASTGDELKINVRRFMRMLDHQQSNLAEYKRGDLGINELELLKNYLTRMISKVNSLVEEGE